MLNFRELIHPFFSHINRDHDHELSERNYRHYLNCGIGRNLLLGQVLAEGVGRRVRDDVG